MQNKDTVKSIFVNEFSPSLKELSEYNSRILFRPYSIMCYALCSIMALIYLQSGAWFWALALIIFAFCIERTARYLRLKQLLKQSRVETSANLGNQKKTFNVNNFEIGNGTFRYEQISKIISANMCLFIVIEKSVTVMVKKDAFTIGDYESFVAFLREKLQDNPQALRGLK